MKHAIVSSSKVTSECWAAQRFTGGECNSIKGCNRPCRDTCEAHMNKPIRITIPRKIKAKDYGRVQDTDY